MKPETQEFLESLTEDDIDRIRKALKTYIFVETLGTVVRWLAISVLALVIGLSQFGDSFKKLLDWFK